MKKLSLLIVGILISISAYAMPDWNEDGSTMACAWAKDIPGGKFVPGKGAPTVTLYFYSESSGKNLIGTQPNDHNYYFAVAKKGPYLKLMLNNKFMGWVSEKQLDFGALRNCN